MKKQVYILFAIVLGFSSCKDTKPVPEPEPEPEIIIAERTTLIYLAANNNLANEAELNLQQIERNLSSTKGNLIVFATLPNKIPTLYHIKPNPTTNIADRKIINQYPNLNSSDPHTLKMIINEMEQNFRSKSYGLILWSHATGWVPAQVGPIKLNSFGKDAGREMDIKELNSVLPKDLFDFIMFDACSMASVEVLYELKDKTKYFIASPGEVIAQGMPYHLIVDDLLESDDEVYKRIAQKYYDHYNNLSGNFQSATVSVIDASKLQNIAETTKKIVELQSPKFPDFNRDEIQRMDFDRFSNPLIAFDFLDFMETNFASAQVNNLRSAMDQAVVFKANTPLFNGFAIRKNSGLTCYIPHVQNEEIVHDYYRSLTWYQASGFNKLL